MPDRNKLIASLEGRIIGGEMHKGGYIHVPQEEAEEILALLKEQERPTAYWEKITGMAPPEYHGHYMCSKCEWSGKYYYNVHEEEYRYCPACGAKMGRR